MPASLVELTLPVAFLRALAIQELGANHPAVALLAQAIVEPEGGMSRSQAESHRRWVSKAVTHCIGEYTREGAGPKAVYAVLLWLADLLERDALELVAGSTADLAITALQDALGEPSLGLMGSAAKQARRIGRRVGELGYFVKGSGK